MGTRVTMRRNMRRTMRAIMRLGDPGRAVASGLLVAVVAGVSLPAGIAMAPEAGAAPRQVSPSTTTPTSPTTTPTTTRAPTTTTRPPVTTTTTRPPVTTTTTRAATTTTTAPATSTAQITPIIECKYYDASTRKTSTVWGYQNLGPAVSVPIGDLNHFDRPAANAGQVTAFKAGRDQNVFVVTVTGASTWTLTAAERTSPGNARACSTNPVPVVSTGLGGLAALAVVTLVMGVVLFWRMKRPRRS
jgi:hypothetical protein